MTDAMKNNILYMIQKGIKQVEISRISGICKHTLSKFLKRFCACKTVKNKKKSGRLKLLTFRGIKKKKKKKTSVQLF